MGKISLKNIKEEIKKSGANKGKFIMFREDEPVRVRFLDDFEDGYIIPFHSSFKLGVTVPCQETFGNECSYCDEGEIPLRDSYVWSVYDYESKEVKLLMSHLSRCTPITSLASLYEQLGSLTDRDLNIKQIGKGIDKTFTIIPMEKRVFKNRKAKPFSESMIHKIIQKAYPDDNSELELDDDEEETPKKKHPTKNTTKKSNKAMNEPEPDEDDWEDVEEDEIDYEDMSAKELYKLCNERDIDCKPKKSKEYYIDLLEEADDDEEDDGWDE